MVIMLSSLSIIGFYSLKEADDLIIQVNKILDLEREHIVRVLGLQIRIAQVSHLDFEYFDMGAVSSKGQQGVEPSGIIPTAKEIKKILDIINNKINQFDTNISSIGIFQILVSQYNFQIKINKIKSLIQLETSKVNSIIDKADLARKNNYSKKSVDQFKVQSTTIRQEIMATSSEIKTYFTEVRNQFYQTIELLHLILLLSIIILGIITIVSILVLLAYVRKSIGKFNNILKDITEGEGDLSIEIPVHSKDTMGMLSISFNLFVAKIRNLVIELKDSINHVQESSKGIVDFTGTSSKDINDIMKKVSEINVNADAQKSNVLKTIEMITEMVDIMKTVADDIDKETVTITSTSYTMKYMVKQFKEIANNSERVDDSAKELLKVAQSGGETVSNTLLSIREIQDDSSKIEDIVHVISSIAEQTNLLAMNAAIEAAHAGEYGKGFAVVADEVRKLAENSSDASKQIINLIRNTVNKIQKSADLSNKSYDALNKILSDTEITAKFMNDITAGMKDLIDEANDILDSIEKLNIVTLKVKDHAEESRSKGETVLHAVNEVREYAVNITESLRSQIKHTESIARNVESLSDFSHLNEKFVEYLKVLSDRFKTSVDKNLVNEVESDT